MEPALRQMLEEVYVEHRQGLYTLSLSITRHPDLAEDAIQEGFSRLMRAGRLPEGNGTAYVFASVRNAALDIVRRPRMSGQEMASIYDLEPSGGGDFGLADPKAPPTPDRVMAANEELARLRNAMEALPAAQREVVAMKVHAGLTFDEIGQALGEPLATVASRYRRALEQLKKNMGELV